MRIQAQAFNRLLYNALLFSPTDSVAGGVSTWWISGGVMTVLASDNYIILSDWLTDYDFDPEGEVEPFYLSRKSVSELEKWSRDVDEVLDVIDADSGFYVRGYEVGDTSVEVVESDDQLWSDYGKVLEKFVGGDVPFNFALAPERLGKISRLKTAEEWPLDLSFGSYEMKGDVLFGVGFKMGPTITGLVAPLFREELKPEGLW